MAKGQLDAGGALSHILTGLGVDLVYDIVEGLEGDTPGWQVRSPCGARTMGCSVAPGTHQPWPRERTAGLARNALYLFD